MTTDASAVTHALPGPFDDFLVKLADIYRTFMPTRNCRCRSIARPASPLGGCSSPETSHLFCEAIFMRLRSSRAERSYRSDDYGCAPVVSDVVGRRCLYLSSADGHLLWLARAGRPLERRQGKMSETASRDYVRSVRYLREPI